MNIFEKLHTLLIDEYVGRRNDFATRASINARVMELLYNMGYNPTKDVCIVEKGKDENTIVVKIGKI